MVTGSDVGYLPEEPLAAPAGRGGVVDVDIVVLGTHGFLHEGLVEDLAVDLHVVLGLHQVTLCTGSRGVVINPWAEYWRWAES